MLVYIIFFADIKLAILQYLFDLVNLHIVYLPYFVPCDIFNAVANKNKRHIY